MPGIGQDAGGKSLGEAGKIRRFRRLMLARAVPQKWKQGRIEMRQHLAAIGRHQFMGRSLAAGTPIVEDAAELAGCRKSVSVQPQHGEILGVDLLLHRLQPRHERCCL